MTSPVAGEAIASRWAVVIRGGKKPLVVEATSSTAEAAGTPPMPTLPPVDRDEKVAVPVTPRVPATVASPATDISLVPIFSPILVVMGSA